MNNCIVEKSRNVPSQDKWIAEAKASSDAKRIGMLLSHTGIVREDARAKVRGGALDSPSVIALDLSYDEDKVKVAAENTMKLPGVYYVRVWVNQGHLAVGEEMMHILIGADIRTHAVDALNSLLDCIKSECVSEIEKS